MSKHNRIMNILMTYSSNTRSFLFRLLCLCVSYPSLITIRVLLQCGADVNGTDFRQSTPMHIFVSNTEDGYESIFELLFQANAHFDYTNDSGEIPLDLVRNANLKRLLMMKTRINLKCLCARLIQKENISFHGMISQSLASFVNKH